MLLEAKFVGAIKFRKGRGHCGLWPGLKRGDSGDKHGGLIPWLPSVGGWQATPGGKSTEPCHKGVREKKAIGTYWAPPLC